VSLQIDTVEEIEKERIGSPADETPVTVTNFQERI